MPLVYTGAPNVIDQLLQVYRGSMPQDVASSARRLDEAAVAAEMVALGEGQMKEWGRQARTGTASGFWLDQHARDEGLSRQGGEGDAALQVRLSTSPAAVIYDAVNAAVQAVIHAIDPTQTAYLERVPVDQNCFCDVDGYADTDARVTPTRTREMIAIVPAALGPGAVSGVLDALRAKLPANSAYAVETF